VLPALCRYQSDIIKKIGQRTVDISAPYDFYGFFESVYTNSPQPLQKAPLRISFKDPHPADTLADYAREVIWYGRNLQIADYTSHYYNSQLPR
jgi:hypothetical protein